MRTAQRHKHADEYIAHLWDGLREACKGAQDQSMAEAQQQRQHYDGQINAILLEPGDLALVKVICIGRREESKINGRKCT